MKQKKLVLFLPFVLLVIGALIFLNDINKQTSKSDEYSGKMSLLQYHFQPGSVIEYKIDYQSEGQGTVNISSKVKAKKSSVNHKAQVAMKGGLILKQIARDDQENYVVEYEFTPDTMNIQYNNKVIPKPERIQTSVVIFPNGTLKSFYMKENVFSNYGHMIREILSLLEFPLPAEAVTHWSHMERNISKDLMANYIVNNVSDDKLFSVVKTYAKASNSESVKGQFDYTFNNSKGYLKSVHGERTIEYKLAQQAMSVSTARLNVEFVSYSKGMQAPSYDNTILGSNTGIIEETLNGKYTSTRIEKEANTSALGNDDLVTLTTKFAAADESDHAVLTKLVQKLSALLYLHPDVSGDVAAMLADYEYTDGRWGAIAASLAYVGHREAQLAIIDALNDTSSDSKTQIALMPHLAFVGKPIVEAEEYFRQVKLTTRSEEAAYKSNNGLGIIAQNLRYSDSDRAKQIYTEVSAELDNESDPVKQVRLIEAIGNMGMEEQTQLLEEYLDSPIKSVKLASIYSLRHINTTDSRSQLLAYLSDDDEKVRESAAMALEYTTGNMDALQKYEQRLKQETNVTILKVILRNLIKMSDDFPQSLAIYDRFLTTCAHRDLCGFAKSLRSMRS